MSFRRRVCAMLLPLVCALGAAGCGSALNIPRPGEVPMKPLPPLPPSVVEIPISVNLAPLFREVEKAVPSVQRAANDWTVVSNNAVGDVGIKYELRRDPLALAVAPNTFRITSRVRYWFQFAQRVPKPIIGGSFWQDLGSCGVGEAPREAVMGLQTRVVWTDDWRLQPSTSVLPTQFTNRCEITFLKFDITSKVNEGFAMGLKQGATIADTRIREAAQFKSMAASAWSRLATPIQLDSGMWLVLAPQSAYAGPLGGTGTTVTGTVGFTVQPRVLLGSKPDASAPPGLPKLVSQAKTGEGFRVTVESALGYDDAARMLAAYLKDRTFTYVGHDVRVTAVKIWGAGDRAVLALQLAGDVNGTVYLLGIPAYDAATNTVYVKDLDYSLETGHVLAGAADWLLHGTFRSSIADGTRWVMDEQIAETRTRIAAALNRPLAPNVVSRGSVSGIRPAGVYLTGSGFTARVLVEGTLRLEVK